MAAINRRSLACPIGITAVLATADDVDGTDDGTQWFDITGLQRVVIIQVANGTSGTLGIDCIEVSKDGGVQWYADGTSAIPATGLLASANDVTGTVLVAGTLNAAGVEPATFPAGLFKFGPYEGPTLIKCARATATRGSGGTGTDWSTGSPTVYLVPIGGPDGGGALATYA
jgi:hypothetical protein